MHPFSQLLANSIPNYNIVGIDPGTDKVGFSVHTYSPSLHKVIATASVTIRAGKLINYDPHVDIHGERSRRLAAITNVLTMYFKMFMPVAVVCEHPFYNNARPGAFEPLVESIIAVRSALFNYDPGMRLMSVDPPSAKKAIGAPGNAKKEQMQAALLAIENSLCYNPLIFGQNLSDLDEHAVDAIAIGRWLVNQLW